MERPAAPKPVARAQSSIRSFFQPRQPIYAAPPPSTNPNLNASNGSPPTAVPPPHTSSPPQRHIEPETSPLKPRSGPASPPQASISPILDKHIQQLKRINSLLLPINYPDSFYHKILDPQNKPNFSQVVLFHEPVTLKSVFSNSEPKVVGGIVCRLEKDDGTRTSAIYIQSLALLSPYRSYGLATNLLDNIIQEVVSTPQVGHPVTSLYAHVWTENTEGLEWYTARGFTREEPVFQGYYRRLQPANAWIMRRSIIPSDHMRYLQKPNGKAPSQNSTLLLPAPEITSSVPENNRASRTQSHLPSTSLKPAPVTRAASYQNTGPGHEWNDLPEEILTSLGKPPTAEPSARAASATHLMPIANNISATGSAASSRSSSRSVTKKKRQYPAAAFGSVSGEKETS